MSFNMGITNDSIGTRTSLFDATIPCLPPPPDPANDPHLSHDLLKSTGPQASADPDDIFKISSTAAMEHLGAGLEALVQLVGDVPSSSSVPQEGGTNMREMQEEKVSIVRSHSERSLAGLKDQAEQQDQGQAHKEHVTAGINEEEWTMEKEKEKEREKGEEEGEGKETNGITTNTHNEAQLSPPNKPYIVVGPNSKQLNSQHEILIRKFYSKTCPPISLANYLARIHRFYPMSVAVYLAASLYIHRLAVEQQAIVVTRRNVHRLVLSGLRVAMKVLEDHTYKHANLAAVGGVRPAELARLEVGFCFLTGFELAVSPEELRDHWRTLRLKGTTV